MSLTPGTRIGPYEVVSAIGAGGMGEVYRARDARLERDVAIKILPAAFAADAERLARFAREAKTLAALNHPNIAQVYGLEALAESSALVMELVDGEDLAGRIARGPVALDETLAIARQIADALDAAHDRGIVHRDLKPGNIKVRADGAVKVLDFGLAKALDPSGASDAALMNSPTITSPATQLGTILGTAAYMAPEQAKGKPVDKRADIWAFGCVLFEMLTGKRAFGGTDVSEVLASVLKDPAPLDALPADTPAALRRLLRRSLEKNPSNRLDSMSVARLEIDEAAAEPAASAARAHPPAIPRRGIARWVTAAIALAAAAVAGVIVWQLRAPGDPPVQRFTIAVPGDTAPLLAAVSPAGDAIAFVADDRVWLQRLDAFAPSEVPASTGAHAVFWSPDGSFLGFQARGQLWKVPMSTGRDPLAIGRVPQEFTIAGGAAWLDDGRIVFTTGGTGLLEIPASGGSVGTLVAIDPSVDADLHQVSALPGGRGLLYVAHPGGNADFRLEVYVPSDGSRRVLHTAPALAWPVYAPSGHIVFGQGSGVWRLAFDLDRLAAAGEPVLVAADASNPSIAGDGTLVMVPVAQAGGDARLTWIDRAGQGGATLGQPGAPVSHPRMSPDGRLVAATVGLAPESDIWVFDVARGTDRRLTFEPGADAFPSWTHDSRFVIYNCGTSICARRADGSGGRIELVTGTLPVSPPVMSPDGRRLLFLRDTQRGDADLWVVDVGPEGPIAPLTGEPRPLIRADRVQRHPDISPNGRFISFASSEAGTFAVYVSTFPEGDGKWEVSRGFGAWPRWGAANDRLYFVDEQGRIVELEVDLTTTFQPGRVVSRIPAHAVSRWGFDIDRGGQRFLVPRSPAERASLPGLLLVRHWGG